MPSKKQQTSSANPNNQSDLFNDVYLLQLENQKLKKEVQELKQVTQSLMLTIKNLLNEQNPQNNETSGHLLRRWKDKLLKSNGMQDKSLARGSINLSKSNFINDRIQNQEECKIRPSSIRKQKKDVDTVKNMVIRQTNAIDSRENNIMKQKEEQKIYLRSIANQTEDQKLQRLHMHGDNLRGDRQNLTSKHQQEDKLDNLQEFRTGKVR